MSWVKRSGTTTVGIVCRDGVVLATDTRVTSGHVVSHKRGKKLFKIDDNIGMTIAGVVADAQTVLDILKANVALFRMSNKRRMSVKAAASLVSNLLFEYRIAPLILQAIIAGYDDEGYHVYTLDPFGSVIEDKYVSTGSGSPIALGVLEDGYKEGMSVEEGIKLAVKAVRSAIRRDVATGDSIDVAVITKEKGFYELSSEEKNRILRSLESERG